MDNFTHSLAGWALGQAGLKTKSRKGLAALILGANAPDIDVIFGSVPWEPLAMHRGFTHSLIGGLIILPVLLWGLLLLIDWADRKRGSTFESGLPLRPGWLLALCFIGVLTHPLFDLQTTYSVQLFTPLSGAWWHMDSLFIIDVWLWAGVTFAIAWSRMREKQGREWRRAAQIGVIGALAYIAGNVALTHYVRAGVKAAAASYGEMDVLYTSPPPVAFWRRGISWRNEDGRLGFARFDALSGGYRWADGLKPGEPAMPDRMDDPLVRRAMRESRSAFGPFYRWSTMMFARIEQAECEAIINFADARYVSMRRRGNDPFRRTVTLDLCPPGQGTGATAGT